MIHASSGGRAGRRVVGWGLAGLLLVTGSSARATIFYVNAQAATNAPADGRTWATAFSTLEAGLAAAQAGDEAWVAQGTYFVPSTLPAGFVLSNGVALYGGFAGSETNRDQRDWTRRPSILDGGRAAAPMVVSIAAGATTTTRLDGVTIRSGGVYGVYCVNASPVIAHCTITQTGFWNRGGGGGIYCTNSSASIDDNSIVQSRSVAPGIYCSYCSLAISNNVIAGNRGDSPSGAGGPGGGIDCEHSAGRIISNRIVGNAAATGGGISCTYSTTEIAFNLIADNRADFVGGGIETFAAACNIHNNRIVGNVLFGSVGSLGGGGISCLGAGSAEVVDNLIVSNVVLHAIGGKGGGGITCGLGASPLIRNNTLVANQAPLGGGLYSATTNLATMVNNLVAFGSSGVYVTDNFSFRNNDVFGNGTNEFGGSPDPTGTAGNLAVDPQLVENDEFLVARLAPSSPCVDAGDSSVVESGEMDVYGQPRVQGAAVDIGAAESDGTLPASVPQIVRVSVGGDDQQDGSSWAAAKRTVQAALDQAARTGGEVWVAAGTYPENLQVRMFTALYGGFAGTETDRAQRDWGAQRTILDGGQAGSVVSASWIGRFAAVDGVTIQNGNATMGGGIYCVGSPIRVQFDTIQNNTAVDGGGIAWLEGERLLRWSIVSQTSPWPRLALPTPYLADNRIVGNRTVAQGTNTANGGGLYLRTSAVVANNLVAENRAENANPAVRVDGLRGVKLQDYGLSAGSAGIFCDARDFSVSLVNNTIVRNQATAAAGTLT